MRKEIFIKTFIFVAAVASVSLLYHNNILLTLILLGLFVLVLRGKLRRYDLLFFFAGAAVCALGEVICVVSGAWTYNNPSFWQVPLWLPVAWGIVSVSLKRATEYLLRKPSKPVS
jgi:hypothetical protein